ncbi:MULTISPECIES: cell division protein FtsZ [Sphingomonas]|uniref:Cell division protein FtsZ n=1 Tax=Sphingomonas adhaesiva TaxID=28212 RepID=A0A2A4IAV1_9SPHN|nr:MULTISPECIES: cell division protein FtsZ [Sphingomonas]PCG14940.1 cell division protein FtsZ [Sphingomonas adhaesiva]PZU81361.1 MAG: cell division protein FtsZ [Sphingomonas sp.]
MSIEFITPDLDDLTPRITVVGVGGAGGNAIANMMRADVQGVNFLVANTDAQALKQSDAEQKIQLGAKITQGLGAGSRPEIGRAAAEETIEELSRLLEGSHMCFIAAGMGGGTGTGAAPVIAKAARDMGILTVGVVTKPFSFEGNRRSKSAEAGIEELQKFVDTLIVIPNQNLFLVANANTTFKQAFEMADEVLQQGVRGITDLMVMPGLINLDFADVRSVMQEMGKAMMGTGEAEGDDRALVAAQKAIANPLLDGVSMQGAKGVIVSITGGDDMRLLEVDEAANHIRELVDPDANIIWGSAFNPELEGKIRVSVVATGIESQAQTAAPVASAPAEPPRTFSFNAPRRAAEAPAAAPQAAAPAPAPTAYQPAPEASVPPQQPSGAAAQAMEAGVPAAGHVPSPQAISPASEAVEDELLLGADAMMPAPAPAAPLDQGDAGRRRFLSPGAEADDAPPQPRVKLGGTLFERMQNATRNAGRGDEEPRDPSDLPRFLHRQNNQ